MSKSVSEQLQCIEDRNYLDNTFKYHTPKCGQQRKYLVIREKGKEMAALILEMCPDSKERKCALERIEESNMWANAAIARNE